MNGNGNTTPRASRPGAMSTHSPSTSTWTVRLTRHTPVGALPEDSLRLVRRTSVPSGRISRRAAFASLPPHQEDSGAWMPTTRTRTSPVSVVMSKVSPSSTAATTPDSRHWSLRGPCLG